MPESSVKATLNSTIGEIVKQQLAQKLAAMQEASSVLAKAGGGPEVNPWLEMTQWPEYFAGQDLGRAMSLINLPSATTLASSQSDRCLSTILTAFGQLIEQSRKSVLTSEINIFNQHRVNSFLGRSSVNTIFKRQRGERPFVTKLKGGTYQSYKLQ